VGGGSPVLTQYCCNVAIPSLAAKVVRTVVEATGVCIRLLLPQTATASVVDRQLQREACSSAGGSSWATLLEEISKKQAKPASPNSNEN
jgi:hypothetical protein